MKRELSFLSLLGIAGIAAILGWRMGQPVTETDIISRYAADYVETHGAGAKLTDCVATPGTGDVRLVVRCSHPDGRRAVYPAGPRGELLELQERPEA